MKNTTLHTTIVSAITILCLGSTVTAQSINPHDTAPLKSWAAPLHWQPEAAGLMQAASTVPQFLNFVAMKPCRVVDTRAASGFPAQFGAPSLAGLVTRTFPIQSSTCSIPASAKAYSFNVTVVPGGALQYLSVYPSGQGIPNVSTLNDPQGVVLANAAIVPAGLNGSVDVYATNATDLVMDINGYYSPPSTSDTENTALGSHALENNTSGLYNTAFGILALGANTIGNLNMAAGGSALSHATTATDNTAVGNNALYSDITGSNNTAIGSSALFSNVSGGYNVALGYSAGFYATGSYNLMIGNFGQVGDDHTIKIGSTQTRAFIAGIRGIATAAGDAVPVVIDSLGQLGTVNSSRRFKEDIHDMGDASEGLLRLRPVTYRYQKAYADGSKPIDYGLIAEEVAQVYPDLVVRGADGRIETVQYQKLTPMLLNELQKQDSELQKQMSDVQRWKDQYREQSETIRLLETRLSALEGLPGRAASSVDGNR